MLNDSSGPRFDAMVSRLAEGEPVTYRDIGISLASDGAVTVSIQSTWRTGAMTRDRVDPDLATAAAELNELLAASGEARTLVAGRQRCLRVIDDYGMGASLVCEQLGDVFRWGQGYGEGSG